MVARFVTAQAPSLTLALTAVSVCITMQSMLASCKKKEL